MAVYSLKVIAERIGLAQALGHDQQGRLALRQVLARLDRAGVVFAGSAAG